MPKLSVLEGIALSAIKALDSDIRDDIQSSEAENSLSGLAELVQDYVLDNFLSQCQTGSEVMQGFLEESLNALDWEKIVESYLEGI